MENVAPGVKEMVTRNGIVAIVILGGVRVRHLSEHHCNDNNDEDEDGNEDDNECDKENYLGRGLAEGEPGGRLEEGLGPSDAVCDQQQLVLVLLNVLVLS